MNNNIDWENLVEYDESIASCLRWKVDITTGKEGCTVSIPSGTMAGSVNNKGYWQVGKDGKLHKAHHIVWTLFNGCIKDGFIIDHFDGDTQNNRIHNLREVTRKVNMRNLKINSGNTSGVSGVYFRKGLNGRADRYVAQWSDLDSVTRTKSFSLSVYGEKSFEMAKLFREDMLVELNQSGAGYTGRNAAQEFAQKLLVILKDKFPESVKAFGLGV